MATLAATLACHPVAESHAANSLLRIERIKLYLRTSPQDVGILIPGYKATIATVRPGGDERAEAAYFDEHVNRLEASMRRSAWVHTQDELDWEPAAQK